MNIFDCTRGRSIGLLVTGSFILGTAIMPEANAAPKLLASEVIKEFQTLNNTVVPRNAGYKRFFSKSLQEKLDAVPYDDGTNYDVAILLRLDVDEVDFTSVGSAKLIKGEPPLVKINGGVTDELAAKRHLEVQSENAKRRFNQKKLKTQSTIRALANATGLSEWQLWDGQTNPISDSINVKLSKQELYKIKSLASGLVQGIEELDVPVDDVASAMVSTGVDPAVLNFPSRQGSGVGIFMTETGCAEYGLINNYTRYTGDSSNHAENVVSILRAVSPLSYIYCKQITFWHRYPTAEVLNGLNGNPQTDVMTMSMSSYQNDSDGEYKNSDRGWDNIVYDWNIPFVKSAGNRGEQEGAVTSPGKGYNSITVGNYDDATDTIANGSSFVDPNTGAAKPDLSAPGEAISAGGHTMWGTSQAAPHVAGFIADILSVYPWMKRNAALVKALMLADSVKPITGGSDKVGVGGLDFNRTLYNGYMHWWNGSNADYDNWAASDNGVLDWAIEVDIELTSSMSEVRMALTWLNRGSFTYDHRADAYPLGMDFSIMVLDPTGSIVASSGDMLQPYELVTFNPTQSGTYSVFINRVHNRDTDSAVKAALVTTWD